MSRKGRYCHYWIEFQKTRAILIVSFSKSIQSQKKGSDAITRRNVYGKVSVRNGRLSISRRFHLGWNTFSFHLTHCIPALPFGWEYVLIGCGMQCVRLYFIRASVSLLLGEPWSSSVSDLRHCQAFAFDTDDIGFVGCQVSRKKERKIHAYMPHTSIKT